jgi:hypothetical protein
MTKAGAMFWSGETLTERLPSLIEPFAPDLREFASDLIVVPTGAKRATISLNAAAPMGLVQRPTSLALNTRSGGAEKNLRPTVRAPSTAR